MNKKLISLVLTFCMLLSCGIPVFAWDEATNDVDLRVGLFSDSHNNTVVIQNVLDAFNAVDPNLDGVVMAGDIVYMSGNTVDETAYDGLMAMQSITDLISANKLVYAMGNHEMPLHGDATLGETSRALFEEKTGLETETVTNIGGYTFIAAGASNYAGDYTAQEEWMTEKLQTALSDNTQKPVFLIIHHPVQGSTYGANAVGYSDEFKAYIESQPRIIVVSGHVHQPMHDPKTIKQIENGCTYIQTAHTANGNAVDDSFATISLPNTPENMDSAAVMMEVKNNVVTLNRMDIKSGEYFGEPWVIDIPKMIAGDASAYKYTDARYDESEAPVFKAGSATVSDVTESAATFTFPAATALEESELDFAEYYRIRIIDEDVMLVKSNDVMISDYFKATQADAFTQTISGLSPGTNYRAEISAISPYFVESEPLTVKFTTEEAVSVDMDYVIEKTTNEADSCAHGAGGDVASSFGFSTSSHYAEWNFTPEHSGMYDISVFYGTVGATTDVTVDGVSLGEKFVENPGSDNWRANEEYRSFGSVAMVAGQTYKVRYKFVSGSNAVYHTKIKATWQREVTPGEIGYNIEMTKNQATACAHGGGSDPAADYGFATSSHYAEWNFTPEFNGVYDISVRYGTLNATTDVTVDGVSLGEMFVENTTEGATWTSNLEYRSFGKIPMLAGLTYKIRFKYVSAGDTVYPSKIKATWEEELDIENTDIEVSRALGNGASADVDKITDTNAASIYGDSHALDNGKYVDISFNVPADAKYDVILVGGSTDGIDYKVAVNNITLEGRFPSTTIYDTDGTTIKTEGFFNHKIEHNVGSVSLKEGTYTAKVSALNSGSLRLHKVILRKSGVYESTFIEEATFDQTTRTDHNISSGNTGAAYIVVEDADAYVEHTVTMSEGNYDLSISYGCQTYEGVIGVYVNGEYYGKFDAPVNNAWNTNQTTLELATVRLKEGENVIKFTAPGGKYYCYTTFSFKAIEEPSVLLYSGNAAEVGKEATKIVDGDMTLRALLPRDVKDKNVRMFFAIYKNGTEVYDAKTLEVTAGAATAIAVPMEDIVLEDGAEYSYRAFFWDGLQNIKPLY